MSEKEPITSQELQAVSQLVTDATLGITDVVESMFHRVLYPSFLPTTRVQHIIGSIASLAFKSVKLVTETVGYGTEAAFQRLNTALVNVPAKEKKILIAILNGIIGDHLVERQNSLAIRMQFLHQDRILPLHREQLHSYAQVNGRLLIMIHGLCMNDEHWTRNHHNHGEQLAKELGFTPIYLHYNTGRHISTNGQELSILMDRLINNWPQPVEEVVILTHSMGGLVSRSALHYGEQQQRLWVQKVKKLFFLGTPHPGAPLERAGNQLDILLENTPYAKPFARIGKIRSAGITDLRYGNLLQEDWDKEDRFAKSTDARVSIPLPENIACFGIAATGEKESEVTAISLLGDGLVLLKSALGQHHDTAKTLIFPSQTTQVFYEHNHLDLLSSLAVYACLKKWLES